MVNKSNYDNLHSTDCDTLMVWNFLISYASETFSCITVYGLTWRVKERGVYVLKIV